MANVLHSLNPPTPQIGINNFFGELWRSVNYNSAENCVNYNKIVQYCVNQIFNPNAFFEQVLPNIPMLFT